MDELQVSDKMVETAENEALTGKGRVPVESARVIRKLRAREQWERYDSIVVGPGATNVSRGWFNNLQEFAKVSKLSWFGSRDSNVDLAYSNQQTERYDYAQDLYNMNVEFCAPPFLAEFARLGAPEKAAQMWWKEELPKLIAFEVLLADSDIIAQGPGTAFMAGRGNAGAFATDSGAAFYEGGNNGLANRDNGWSFPEPIMLAAQAKLTVRAFLAQPLKDALLNASGPGYMDVPKEDGTFVQVPNWFFIRVNMRGPRYMQLRGARSQG